MTTRSVPKVSGGSSSHWISAAMLMTRLRRSRLKMSL
jgi:hypothetical protein